MNWGSIQDVSYEKEKKNKKNISLEMEELLSHLERNGLVINSFSIKTQLLKVV